MTVHLPAGRDRRSGIVIASSPNTPHQVADVLSAPRSWRPARGSRSSRRPPSRGRPHLPCLGIAPPPPPREGLPFTAWGRRHGHERIWLVKLEDPPVGRVALAKA